MPKYEWFIQELDLREDRSPEAIVDELELALEGIGDKLRYQKPGLGLEVTSHSVFTVDDKTFLTALIRTE